MTNDTKREGIICAGNWIVDIVHEIDHWPQKSNLAHIAREARGVGGGAANVVTALARFRSGLPLIPFGAIGNDEHAGVIFDTCESLDLTTDYLICRDDVPTAHTHVMSVPGDSRTFFYHGGANDALTADAFGDDVLVETRARLFYLGYLMLLEQLDQVKEDGTTGASDVLKKAKGAGLVTCVDFVSSERDDFAAVVRPSLPHIDYLIINEFEACQASGISVPTSGQIPDDDMIELAARTLLDRGVQHAVVIHCPEKALWMGRDDEAIWSHPTPLRAEEVVSPVGAGDAFCAGILYAIHQSLPAATALGLAHASARASLGGMTATDAIPPLTDLAPALISDT